MLWFAAMLILVAACAFISLTPGRPPALIIGFYWIASLTGQLFALPLALVGAILAIVAEGAASWVFSASALLFALVHWRNRRAARLLLDAAGLQAERIPLHAGLAPFLTGGAATRRIKALSYGPAGKRNLADIVVSRGSVTGPMPVLIHLHGGAWTTGERNQQGKPLINHMAARGWLCVDATYRLGPKSRGPDWIVDVLRVIAWVRANAANYGGDPARIAITGGSSGGHLASLAALAHDDPAFKPGFESADCSVAAAVPLYGRYDFLDRRLALKRNHAAVIDKYMAARVMPGPASGNMELWRAVSPLDRVRSAAPPMFIIHGTGDTMLPWTDARDFAEALRAVSQAEVKFVALPGIQHGWDMAASAVVWGQVRAVAAFLAPLEASG